MKHAIPRPISRRQALAAVAGCGIGTAAFHRTLAAMVEQQQAVSPEMISAAQWACGIEFNEVEQTELAADLSEKLDEYRQIRQVPVDYRTPPALTFLPEGAPEEASCEKTRPVVDVLDATVIERPDEADDLAFMTVAELSRLLRHRKVTSQELTELYLARLKRFNSVLNCVVTLTEDLARQQSRRADEEIAGGHYRGPLHGIPWGAKDLIAVPGHPTTWGAEQFREQVLDETATVAARLEEAGAVLVAKLALGNLALGDQWFGGMTRNPWNPEQGSSGSSAGSAAAVVAGLVGFAIGSETLGSIISPCRRCGATGLRPTFGRVSRYGCMPLSWSMDKLGPITRCVEDCGLVLAAIHGRDGKDPTAVNRPFAWPSDRELKSLRGGYFVNDTPLDQRPELVKLAELGVTLVPIELPARPRLAAHADAGCRGSHDVRRFDAATQPGRSACLAPRVSVCPVRPGRRVSPRSPGENVAHAGHGRTLLSD